jgi:uncharacterized membrane protein YhfC
MENMDIFVRTLNALLMIALPLSLGVFLAKRFRTSWRIFMVGAITFVASQIFHLPFNGWVLSPLVTRLGLTETHSGLPLLVFALVFGLSAGVFEELARYVVYRFWLRDVRSWRGALMFGAGHGGIEAILLGGLAVYALLQAVAYRGADLSAVVPPEQLSQVEAQLNVYWSLPWYLVLLGAFERLFAICFHLSASVLVLQALIRRSPMWVGFAILWHTLLDAVALFGIERWGPYVTEGVIGLLAAASIVIVLALRKPSGAGAGDDEEDALLPQASIPDLIAGDDEAMDEARLDETRFN